MTCNWCNLKLLVRTPKTLVTLYLALFGDCEIIFPFINDSKQRTYDVFCVAVYLLPVPVSPLIPWSWKCTRLSGFEVKFV